jgi:NAD+ synthase
MQTGKVIDHIVKWLKDYAVKNPGVKGFTVGISNGIDSSVVSTLCARTGLPVLALELPIDLSKKKEKSKSIHVEWLKKKYGTDHIRTMNVNLTDAYKVFKETCTELQSNDKTELALANLQSRMRMVEKKEYFLENFIFLFLLKITLYYFAQLNGYLVAGTGNKVEDFGVGFFTKYGRFDLIFT